MKIRDDLINLPDLIARAEAADPALAASLTEKRLIGSKSVWAPAATWIVTGGLAHYGVQMDADTSAMIASLLAWLVVILCRAITRSPIGGVFSIKGKI